MEQSSIIFQASDLNQQGRAVLAAARAGEARVRDKDGVSLVVIPETRLRIAEEIQRAVSNLIAVERTVEKQSDSRSPHDYGEWTWLRVFDADDLREFVDAMRDSLIISIGEQTVKEVRDTLRQWRLTANQLDDPLRRSILLRTPPPAYDDFVEVARPE